MHQESLQQIPRLVVLISGGGSNLQTLIDAIAAGTIVATIELVISNQPNAMGLARAHKAGIATQVVNHLEYSSREAFDRELIRAIDDKQPELVVLAGFMRIFTPELTNHYHGRMLNIHPSLLPLFKGTNTHERALEAEEDQHGASVHFVTSELDGGPIVIQAIVPVLEMDSPSVLAARVLVQEHIIYPIAIKWFCEGRLTLQNATVSMDGHNLPVQGMPYLP
ncbi:phosphoribosylglycinamide formyltransferase [Oceanospirillaceae bacterium]|jgi:phosphoribosylglycinamide formyltransferase-1|uniref:phosphoribosylglycinamide formyltransferase n=1 Tax=Candidatus Njordibacter sp. Uisw_002 TaxID=3230971 RepID=UPI00237091FC|nr:phosphoribosylglycinamide formyltransferase [Oceanospirillaceae bacterium]MDB9973063.1 phosphoribosylglycinamide formyltransferase [Oceanospirillaceae bacterium]MDC1341446.1 phosphoribosylglycinamide formyltransferase [Oceanospirillaceae bacterium]|tara:strand:+ start:2683 stop:3348 length:666 start_codon:yes stop_codon:yes gene_type:complete